MKRASQKDRILDYLEHIGGITQYTALQQGFGLRLASRVCELRKYGWLIKDRWIEYKNAFDETVRFKEYYIGNNLEKVFDVLNRVNILVCPKCKGIQAGLHVSDDGILVSCPCGFKSDNPNDLAVATMEEIQ